VSTEPALGHGASAQESGKISHTGSCGPGPCGEAKAHLWEFVDGELGPDDCARIREHIEACPPCGELYFSERKIKDVVARACACESAPQALKGRVMVLVTQLRTEVCGRANAGKVPGDKKPS